MRLAAGWYRGARRSDGRLDDIYVYADGTARRGTVNSDGACVHVGCPEVDLDDYVCVAASEPGAARADDGARVEAGAARAEEGHGWSVSATRTIGNVGERERGGRVGYDYAATGCVIHVRVMHDPSPLAPPVLPQEPSPGKCPTCGVQRRERGEVRVHYWKCGCAVRPDFEGPALDTRWAGRGRHEEAVQRVSGFGVASNHPTRDGALAAWREALAEAQRREDACR